jgi:hypothetical protein
MGRLHIARGPAEDDDPRAWAHRIAIKRMSPVPGTVLPGGRRHGHFPQMWQFKKIDGRGKFVAVSGRKVAVKGPKRLKSGRRKLFYKSLVKLIET